MADEEDPKPQPPAELVQWAEELRRKEKERQEQLLDKLSDTIGRMTEVDLTKRDDK